MKNAFTNTMILTAAAMALGMTASAASEGSFKAEVPFAFQIGSQKYAAGQYEATVNIGTGGFRMLVIMQAGSGRSKVAMTTGIVSPESANSDSSTPKLVFRCGDNGCALAQLWTGQSPIGMMFRAPRPVAAGTQRLAVVRMQTVNGD